jgi:eukaryotic-like serine/threonine-protein kinase
MQANGTDLRRIASGSVCSCGADWTAPKACVVPKLKGKTLTAAKRSIKTDGCSVGRIKHATSPTIEKGRVISQKPEPGKRLKHGAKVNLLISEGRRP